MSILINVVDILFDLFILLVYFNHLLKKKKDGVPAPVFYGAFLLMEAALFLNTVLFPGPHGYASYFITSFISFSTTFALCFLYESTVMHRFFTSLLFQIFALFGEGLFTNIILYLKPDILSLDNILLTAVMNLGSKIVLFILVLGCIAFWDRKIKNKIPNYNRMLFVTPAITLFVMLFFPTSQVISFNLSAFFIFLFSCLIILNIINYFMLNYVVQLSELKAKNMHMQQQIAFQTDKYQQLSAAYRKSRSIVHDTKKHYFSIQSYIQNRDFEQLNEYLKSAVADLENTYAKINTGNLVIDAFVSSYLDIASDEGIQFDTDIHVDPNRIPVKDYDLCVILGNLLDNSLQACRKIVPPMKRYILVHIYIAVNNTFVIHLSNTVAPTPGKRIAAEDSLTHGYGLENVKAITESYHGMYSAIVGDTYDAYVIIPIIEK